MSAPKVEPSKGEHTPTGTRYDAFPPKEPDTTINSELDEIFETYGYFLGLAYEDENGNLATHKTGKVKQEILKLIAQEANKARIEENKLYTKFLSEYYSGKHDVDLDSFLYNRIAQLTEQNKEDI